MIVPQFSLLELQVFSAVCGLQLFASTLSQVWPGEILNGLVGWVNMLLPPHILSSPVQLCEDSASPWVPAPGAAGGATGGAAGGAAGGAPVGAAEGAAGGTAGGAAGGAAGGTAGGATGGAPVGAAGPSQSLSTSCVQKGPQRTSGGL